MERPRYYPIREGLHWCNTHERPATHIYVLGNMVRPCCKQGMSCQCVELTGIAEAYEE